MWLQLFLSCLQYIMGHTCCSWENTCLGSWIKNVLTSGWKLWYLYCGDSLLVVCSCYLQPPSSKANLLLTFGPLLSPLAEADWGCDTAPVCAQGAVLSLPWSLSFPTNLPFCFLLLPPFFFVFHTHSDNKTVSRYHIWRLPT